MDINENPLVAPVLPANPVVLGRGSLGVKQEFATSSTGARKEIKLARFDLIPPGPLLALAEHFGTGAKKYADRNWELGYSWSLSFAALNRHLWAFWGGEDIDPETGSPHMVAVMWHSAVLLEFATTHPDFDNRPHMSMPVRPSQH